MHKAAWVLWLTNQPWAGSIVVPSATDGATSSYSIPDSESQSSSIPAPDSASVESGSKSVSFEVSTESATYRSSQVYETDTGPISTPVLLPMSVELAKTFSESKAGTASASIDTSKSVADASFSKFASGSESAYVYHPAFTPASAPATKPASLSTVSLNVVLPDSLQSITQYHSVSHYAPGPFPATAPGTAPAIAPASMAVAVVDDGPITVTRHGAAATYLEATLETLSQPWNEALFGSLESAVWSPDGQYLLFSDSEHAVLPESWAEDDRPDATKLGRIYKWDATTEEISVFLESAGTIGPDDASLPEAPALADKMTAGAVGLAWGWEAGDLLLTQYAMRRVVKLNVQDVQNGEVPIEKVVPWSGSMSPNADEGSFNGPHNVFVANDVALFTDPPMGLELQAWDENGRKIPFSWQTTDQLKAAAGATATNGVYAVDQHRSTHLIIDDIQMPHGVSWSHDRIYVSGSRAGTPATPEQSGIFVYETERGDPSKPWQSKMIDGSLYMAEGEGYFGSMALAGDVLLVAGPSGIYIVDTSTVELVGFVEFSKCFPVGLAAGKVTSRTSEDKNYAFILTQCMDSGRPSLKRLELKTSLEVADPVDMCTNGKSQSPVDLPACVSVPQLELSTDWGVVPMSRGNGAGLELSFDAPNWPPPSMTALGMEYHLQKCHLFQHAAHTISGQRQELELQCVHAKDFSDRLGVLSVIFMVGDEESEFLSQIQTMGSTVGVDFDALFNQISDKSRYWSYTGSQMPSSMCTENVDHFIIMEKLSMSMGQALYFENVAGAARLPQPLGDRRIGGCFGEAEWYPYDEHQWAYSVDKHHVVCAQGTKQSPINLEYCPERDRVDRSRIVADWGSMKEMKNSGHSIVLIPETGKKTNIEATSYTLMECHLHLGSEHFVDSRQQAAELQCAHTRDSMPGVYGLISLLLDGGGANDHVFFAGLAGLLPSKSSGSVNLESGPDFDTLGINDASQYWSYEGSWTTPPCTEAVDWFVLMQSQTLSTAQLNAISAAIGWDKQGGNFRPPQPLHERAVFGCLVQESHGLYGYGALEWGGICQTGSEPDSEQSPIDLRSCAEGQGLNRPDRLNFDGWRRAPVKVRLSNTESVTLTPFKDDHNPLQDSHHEPQEDNLYSIMSGTDRDKIMYKLEQCNIHWGSEHTVDGKQFMAEMQCVQRRSDDTTRYGILGILWEVGDVSHRFWEPIEDHLPQKVKKQLRHYPGPDASASSISAPATESVFDTPRRLQSSAPSEVPVSAYSGISVEDENGAPAYLSAPFTVSKTFSVPFEGKIPGYIPAVTAIPSPDYKVPTLQWPSNVYPSLAKAEVPALPATLAGSNLKHTASASATFPATQAVMWGFPLEPSHGIERPYWRTGCHTLARDECCAYLDGRHDQHYGQVCVAAEATFSTGNECEPQCVVTGDCPWGAGSDEVENVAMCADQVEHWVNFEHLFSTLDLDNFWNYHGSLTTPPCSEVVDWYILMSPAYMSESQFTKLQVATGEVAANGNFRPPQLINGRVPEGCTMYSAPWIGKADAPADTYPYDQDAWNNEVVDASAACAVGKRQSPINLDACVAKDEPMMELDWGMQAVSLELDHGLKVTTSGSASSTIKGRTYTLQNCQWRSKSEHTVDDHQHQMETHCVHTRATTDHYGVVNEYGVVGIFWEIGRHNVFFDQIKDSLPVRPAPTGTTSGHISCGNGVMAESCEVCGAAGQCGSPDGDCEPGIEDDTECVLRRRDCGRGIHVQGSCADCPEDQCDSPQCAVSGSPPTCQLVSGDRRLTETSSSVVGTVPVQVGDPVEVITIPASRAIPSTISASYSVSGETSIVGGSEPGLVPDVGEISLTPGYVSDYQTTSSSVSHSLPATQSQSMNWGFPVLPEHSLHRLYAPDGCTSLDLENCCFYMDGVREEAADGPHMDDLHSLPGNSYGQPCRPVLTGSFTGETFSCAPECWVTGDCAWYISNEDSREDEAGVCMDRFATQGRSINMNLLFNGPDTPDDHVFPGLNLRHYWSYEGSLTTPPCSETVEWYVLMDPAELTQEQQNMLWVGITDPVGNFRPPQPLHGRMVDGCVYHAAWYSGEYINEEWGYYVEGAHSVCSEGQHQSPVDLTSCVNAMERDPVHTVWGMLDFSMTTGHAVKLSLTSTGAVTHIGGVQYTLQQCSFHWGSEHTIDHFKHRMETHCVHTKDHNAGIYGVVGWFYQVAESTNAFMASIEDDLPSGSDEFMGTVDFDALMIGINRNKYWSYDGSFTTPPCTEVVDWYIMMDPAHMTETQFSKFQMAIGHAGGVASANGNFRPPQPLNDRPVVGCMVGPASSPQWWNSNVTELDPYTETWHHAICDHGMKQSPVDIPVCAHVVDRPAMKLTWGTPSGVLSNNGHAVVFALNDASEALSVIVHKHYTLIQCEFHWGSEHFIEGLQQRMEVHCVHHKNGHAGEFGVIGMFYRVGSASDASAFVALLTGSDRSENQLPSAEEEVVVQSLALENLVEMADLQHFWSYEGSFTKPPCTEVVDWYILMDHAVMSPDQYDKFQTAIGLVDSTGGNFRMPQPLNGRHIDGCHIHDDDDVVDMCDSGGSQQSPIDLVQCTGREVSQLPLVVEWGQQTVTISSEGDLRLDLVGDAPKPTSILKGTEYTLLGCSFHWTSEHTVYTNSYDLELQCLHQGYSDANTDTMGIVSIFFETGAESLFVSDFASDLNELPDTEGVNFDNLWNGIDRAKYWDYRGSLTTSPCTENVNWYVMMQVAKLSSQQLSAITSTIGRANFRPPQALNGRAVGGCVPPPPLYPYNQEHWGSSDEVCSTGMMQSPIGLSECSARLDQPAINMDLSTQQVEVVNTGHTVKLHAENPVPATMVGEVAYTLRHCEFHWGSEHFVENEQQRFEAQCVHTKVLHSNRYGIVAIFFRLGSSDNAFFAPFEDSLAPSSSPVQRQANFDLLMADLDTRHYWSYDGSFTTPPCTEVVDWYVMMDPSTLSVEQFDKFQMAIGWIEENGNFRPPQQLNSRGVLGCQVPTTPAPPPPPVPLPPYEEVHAGACMGGWLGTNLKTGSVNGCHLACLDMPACGYFSYNDIDNTCARYSPFQRCPEDVGNRYPTYRSFRENRNIFENLREVSSYEEVHEGPCASGWLSSQNARMDTAEDCSQWCAGHLICRYFAFSSSSQMCSLYSAYSMCPARTDNRYAGTDWVSYILYTAGEEVHPAAPTPEENQNFFFVHQGHCAAGWMSGHNAHVTSLEDCITKCFMTPTCGYVSYSEHATTCSLYRGNARCPADNNYPDFASYRIAMV